MSKRIEIQVPNGILDIDTEIGFGVTYLLSDIKDPEKRKSSFTKTITLPGTKNNNLMMGSLFDVNTTFDVFNPNIKTPAKILVDGTCVLNGYLQLKNIKKLNNTDPEGNKINYEVVMYDTSNNFFADVGEKMLTELDFQEFDHTYGHDAIVATWNSGHTWSDSTPYAYPHLFKDSVDYVTSDFKPGIFHKSYLLKIAAESGYQLGGQFIDDFEPYNHEIIPFCNKDLLISTAVQTERKFRATIDNTTNNQSYLFNQYSTYLFPTVYNFNVNNDVTAPGFDNSGAYNATTSTWVVPANGNYSLNFNGKVTFRVTPQPLGAGIIAVAQASPSLPLPNIAITPNPGQIQTYVQAYRNGVTFGSAAYSIFTLPPVLSQSSIDTPVPIGVNFFNTFLNKNDVITFKVFYRVAANQHIGYATAWNGLSSTKISWALFSTWATTTTIWNEPAIGLLTDGDELELSRAIPIKLKQRDLFTDIRKRYNIYISTDPDNDKKIILETREYFYNKSGTTRLDWTLKKDYSTPDKITLLSDLQNKKIDFTYTPSDDSWNKDYTLQTTDIYGVKKVIFDNEFIINKGTISTPLSPTPLIYAKTSMGNDCGMIVPALDTVLTETNPRVLYYNGAMSGNPASNTFPKYTWVTSGGTTQSSNSNTYAYCGHLDNPWSPSLDLNYGENSYYWINTFSGLTNNNLYNTYWSSYINQLAVSRLVTSKFDLDEVDISFIKDNLNTKIFVHDSWYWVSKIVDFDPTNNELTEVELIKIDEGVEFQFKTGQIISDVPVPVVYTDSEIKSLTKTLGIITDYDQTNDSDSARVVIAGSENRIGAESDSTMAIGSGNTIGSEVSDSGILGGSNNFIYSGVKNSWVIGADYKIIKQDNEIWIGGLHILDGRLIPEYNMIDGGEDKNLETYPKYLQNYIDGGEDELRAYNSTNSENYIEGGETL